MVVMLGMSDAVVVLEPVAVSRADEVVAAPPGIGRSPGRVLARCFHAVASGFDWLFGAVILTFGLAILAATPVAQLLCFGYLLEAAGRVARSGRLREAFVGVRKASRLGSMVIGVALFVLPLELLSSQALSAELIDPGGPIARRWRVAVVALSVLVVLHVIGACARGGRVRHFLMPFGNPLWIRRRLRRGGLYTAARDAVWQFVVALRLPYYFRLGFFGFIGTMAWLAVPVSLLALGHVSPAFDLPGALLLGLVAMPLPFLQTRFAVDGRFRSLFALGAVRQRYQRAPWAFTFALLLTLTGALPLLLLKIQVIPRETIWVPSLVFLAFTFPARVVTGWAYGRSLQREPRRHWFFRWTGRLPLVPVAAFYVLVVFLSQYTSWRGIWSLYEQHAFLLPVPFLGL
jgi:hypothetical protein